MMDSLLILCAYILFLAFSVGLLFWSKKLGQGMDFLYYHREASFNIVFVLLMISSFVAVGNFADLITNIAHQKLNLYSISSIEKFIGWRSELGGIQETVLIISFLLWAFVLPAHLYSNYIVKQGKKRPIFTYVINFLVGVILTTPQNPFGLYLMG